MEKVSIMDSCMRILEDDYSSNTFYFLIYVNENFKKNILVQALERVLEKIPRLESYLKKGFFRDRWVVNPNRKLNHIFQERIVDIPKEDIKAGLINAFLSQKGKSVCSEEGTFKIDWYHGSSVEDKHSLLVIAFHHAAFDGRGASMVIRQLCEDYQGCSLNKQSAAISRTYHYSHWKLIKAIGFSTYRKASGDMKAPEYVKYNQALLSKEEHRKEYIDRDKLKIAGFAFDENQKARLKSVFYGEQATMNDIIMYSSFLMMQDLNKNEQIGNQGYSISMKVDLRRYFSNEVYAIGNFFAPQLLSIPEKSLMDRQQMSSLLKQIKSKPIGVGFYKMITLLHIMPIRLTEKIMRSLQDSMKEQSYQEFSITNAGRMDHYLEAGSEWIDGLDLIPSASKLGLPVMQVYSYKGHTYLRFVKYEDEEGNVSRISGLVAGHMENLLQSSNSKFEEQKENI